MTKRKNTPNEEATTFDGMVDSGESADAPSTALDIYTDAPNFDAEDLLMPQLRLAQALTAEVGDGEAVAGQWIIGGFEAKDEIRIVPLLFGRMRKLRDEDTFEIECESKGAEFGEGDPGGVCADCDLAKWTGTKGNRRPPACNFIYGYIVYSYEHDTLATLQFQVTSLPTGKKLNTIISRRGFGKCVVDFKSKKREGKRGVFYVPSISPGEDNDEIIKAAQSAAAQGL